MNKRSKNKYNENYLELKYIIILFSIVKKFLISYKIYLSKYQCFIILILNVIFISKFMHLVALFVEFKVNRYLIMLVNNIY